MSRELVNFMDSAKIYMNENTVIVIRGRLSRYMTDQGKTALTMNEVPRLVLLGGTQVLG
jgi:hypothetical protein